MKHYILSDFDGNTIIIGLENLAWASSRKFLDGKLLEFSYYNGMERAVYVAGDKANLLIDDIYRSLEEPKNETIPF